MADDWLGISSTQYDSHCGDTDGHTIEGALDGTDYWSHEETHTHWFVIDLGETHTIKKVKGHSFTGKDPIDVNIYIDDSNPPTTLVHEGISTWQDTANWVEITLDTEGTGRYIKVEIEGTEAGSPGSIMFGSIFDPFIIFDAYGDVAGGEAFFESLGDTLSVGDSMESAAAYKRAPDDTLSLSDSRKSLFKPKLADTLNISDDIATIAAYKRTAGDSLSVGDGLIKEVGIPIEELLSIADALKKTFKTSLSDTLSISDLLAIGVIEEALFDTLTISDVLELKWKISLGEELSIADQLLVARVFYLTDTLSISDALTHQFIVPGGLTDLTQTPALIVTKCYAIADDVPKTEKLRIWARARDGKETIIYVDPA